MNDFKSTENQSPHHRIRSQPLLRYHSGLSTHCNHHVNHHYPPAWSQPQLRWSCLQHKTTIRGGQEVNWEEVLCKGYSGGPEGLFCMPHSFNPESFWCCCRSPSTETKTSAEKYIQQRVVENKPPLKGVKKSSQMGRKTPGEVWVQDPHSQ